MVTVCPTHKVIHIATYWKMYTISENMPFKFADIFPRNKIQTILFQCFINYLYEYQGISLLLNVKKSQTNFVVYLYFHKTLLWLTSVLSNARTDSKCIIKLLNAQTNKSWNIVFVLNIDVNHPCVLIDV